MYIIIGCSKSLNWHLLHFAVCLSSSAGLCVCVCVCECVGRGNMLPHISVHADSLVCLLRLLFIRSLDVHFCRPSCARASVCMCVCVCVSKWCVLVLHISAHADLFASPLTGVLIYLFRVGLPKRLVCECVSVWVCRGEARCADCTRETNRGEICHP